MEVLSKNSTSEMLTDGISIISIGGVDLPTHATLYSRASTNDLKTWMLPEGLEVRTGWTALPSR